MIIFLDFDGVLHPEPLQMEMPYCHIGRLEAILRRMPMVQVVISSSARHYYRLPDLQSLFAIDLRQRIIGVMPVVPHIFNPLLRYDEIMAWIDQNQYTGPWIALDDAKDQFPPALPQLVACDSHTGMDASVAADLLQRLSDAMEDKSHSCR